MANPCPPYPWRTIYYIQIENMQTHKRSAIKEENIIEPA